MEDARYLRFVLPECLPFVAAGWPGDQFEVGEQECFCMHSVRTHQDLLSIGVDQ